jgi:surface antigen
MKIGRSAFVGASMLVAAMFGSSPAQAQFWQCAPYARMISGIDIYGNAGTWWSQAAGRYDRGRSPTVGAVVVMKPHGKMRVGHVAMVSRIVSDREIKVTHANWSRRGGVERDVRMIDVSSAGDWSQVKVWYAGNGDLGSTAYPTFGFVYPKRAATVQFTSSSGATVRGAALR